MLEEEPQWKRIWMKLTHIQRRDQSERHVPLPLSRPQWAGRLCKSSSWRMGTGKWMEESCNRSHCSHPPLTPNRSVPKMHQSLPRREPRFLYAEQRTANEIPDLMPKLTREKPELRSFSCRYIKRTDHENLKHKLKCSLMKFWHSRQHRRVPEPREPVWKTRNTVRK